MAPHERDRRDTGRRGPHHLAHREDSARGAGAGPRRRAAGSRHGTCGRWRRHCPPPGSPSRWSSSRGGWPGKKVAPAPKTLDAGWRGAVARAGRRPDCPWSRADGARGAGRLPYGAGSWAPHAVLALAFPLHPPGKPEKSRAGELLGRRAADAGGAGREAIPSDARRSSREGTSIVEVPYGDHGFAVPKRADPGQEAALAVLTDGVGDWMRGLGLPAVLPDRAVVIPALSPSPSASPM